MPASNLIKVQMEKRLALVEYLDSRGWSQQRIADEIGVSQPRVSQYLKRIADRYIRQQMLSHKRKLAMKKERLRRQRKTLWDAWDKSWQDKEKRTSETISGKGQGKGRKKATHAVERRLPAVEIQRLILENEKEDSRLDNLYPGSKTELTGPEGRPIEFIEVPEIIEVVRVAPTKSPTG